MPSTVDPESKKTMEDHALLTALLCVDTTVEWQPTVSLLGFTYTFKAALCFSVCFFFSWTLSTLQVNHTQVHLNQWQKTSFDDKSLKCVWRLHSVENYLQIHHNSRTVQSSDRKGLYNGCGAFLRFHLETQRACWLCCQKRCCLAVMDGKTIQCTYSYTKIATATVI